ncbi:MAG: SWIM zinc finger family protein [Nanoarchaeota archaeon]|nr:SWIM zinc finger family protein [Nanoarchaeota archaeon]
MNIKKTKEGYKIESSSRKGNWYEVDPEKPWCDCPAYKFRELKKHGVCKHIKAVREYIEKTQQKTLTKEQKKADDVLAFIESNGGEADAIELIEKFGEERVDKLIHSGEIIERAGKIKILK